jgi:hypothetical protein
MANRFLALIISATAAGTMGRIVLLVSHLSYSRKSHGQSNEPIRVTGQVLGQLVVRLESRDEDVEAENTEDVGPGPEVRVADIGRGPQARQRHLGQDHGLALQGIDRALARAGRA